MHASSESAPQPMRTRTADETNSRWYHGSRYAYLLRSEDTGGAFAWIDALNRRGYAPPPHLHNREHELFYVTDGAADVLVAGDCITAHPGDLAFLPRGLAHTFAPIAEWSRMQILVLPGGFEKYLWAFSVPASHMGEPPLPDGPPDIPRMIALGKEYGIEFLPPDASMADYPRRQTDGLQPVIRKRGEGEHLNVIGIEICVKIAAAESAGLFSLFETHDPPKMGPPLHTHEAEEETVFVVEGEYMLRTKDEIRPAPEGTLCHWPRGVPHAYANAGGSPGRLLVLTTPGGFEAFFRDVDARRLGPGDSAALTRVAASHRLDIVGPPIFT